jgi:hypothetical protein
MTVRNHRRHVIMAQVNRPAAPAQPAPWRPGGWNGRGPDDHVPVGKGLFMAHIAVRQGAARAAVAGVLLRVRASRPRLRRQQEYARLALTELDIRRLDERIDALLDVLAQACDFSGQPDAAREFRALSTKPAEPETVLRLVHGQQ